MWKLAILISLNTNSQSSNMYAYKNKKKIIGKKGLTGIGGNLFPLEEYPLNTRLPAGQPLPSFESYFLLFSCPSKDQRLFSWPLAPFPGQPTGLALFPALSFSFLRSVSLVRCQDSKALSLLQEFLVLWPLERSVSNYLWYRGI